MYNIYIYLKLHSTNLDYRHHKFLCKHNICNINIQQVFVSIVFYFAIALLDVNHQWLAVNSPVWISWYCITSPTSDPKIRDSSSSKACFFWVFHTSRNGLLGDRCWFQRCVSPLRGEVNVGPTQVCDPIHVFHVYPFLGKQFLVGGFKHGFYLPFHIWDVIRNPLMNSIIFQRGGSTHQPGCCFF